MYYYLTFPDPMENQREKDLRPLAYQTIKATKSALLQKRLQKQRSYVPSVVNCAIKISPCSARPQVMYLTITDLKFCSPSPIMVCDIHVSF